MLFAPGSSQTRVLIVLRKPRDWSPPKRGFFFPTPIVRVPGRKAGQLSIPGKLHGVGPAALLR